VSQEVVTAYEVLVDEPTRRAYDEFIDGEEVRGIVIIHLSMRILPQ